jgi:hypothetical protein
MRGRPGLPQRPPSCRFGRERVKDMGGRGLGVMNRLLDGVPSETREHLGRLADLAGDIEWPYEVAREKGWRLANEEYHRAQRLLGRREMELLVAAVHVTWPIDATVDRDLVVAATEVFLNRGERRMVSRIRNEELRLFGTNCPLYNHFLDQHWHGLTACGCFARRRGWYDALAIDVVEDVLMNKKWGDPACQLAVRFHRS